MKTNRRSGIGGRGGRVGRGVRRGFTLLEVLVAIGVLTFVSVAIATIFDAIGDTLVKGKKISELNQFASRIESVMRKDFESMSRDGFMVIRHEYAMGAGKDENGALDGSVFLFDGDADPRPRRVDQMMFFSTDEFSSSRSDIYAGLTPTSGEARIYYGHGQKRTRDYSPDSPYLVPNIRDDLVGTNDSDFRDSGARLGQESTPGIPNPNEYASDWSLLRHVTVLSPAAPDLAQLLPDYSDGGLFGYEANRDAAEFDKNKKEYVAGISRKVVVDRPYQIALQPAITSVFWNAQPFRRGTDYANGDIDGVPGPVSIGYSGFTNLAQARFTSGLVDVASTSLAEIESIVTSSAFYPNIDGGGLTSRGAQYWYRRQEFNEEALIVDGPGPSVENFLKRFPFTVTSPAQQRAWMINAMPTHPAEPDSEVEIGDPLKEGNYASGPTSPRIRYEQIPPDLAGTLSDAGGVLTDPRKRLVNAYRAADQEMLSRSIFVPRCTEFIVEWTFGEVYDDYSKERNRKYPDLDRIALLGSFADLESNPESTSRGRALWKKFVWYGRDGWTLAPDGKPVDLDGDGDRDYDLGDRTTRFFSRKKWRDDLETVRNVEYAMERHNNFATNDRQVRRYSDQDFAINMAKESAKNPRYISGREPDMIPLDNTLNGRRVIETSTFGYYVYDAGQITQNTDDDLILNWPWPKLIRITFRLADPNDPGVESTYQVVFEVPDREAD